MKWYHKQSVTCEIEGEKITDAKISIDPGGGHFVCQNKRTGCNAKDKLGYTSSWYFEPTDPLRANVTNLRPVEEFYPVKGDILVWPGGIELLVLGVLEETVVFYSHMDNHDLVYGYNTVKQLEKAGVKIKALSEPSNEVDVVCEGKTVRISRKSAVALGLIKD